MKDNRVLNTILDQQAAAYLKKPSNLGGGNLVLSSGTMDFKEMTQSAPQVIEILQFSALFGDPHSTTFSSEIRLARLYDNERGKVTYLKGGALSGSFFENFKKVRFSKDSTRHSIFETIPNTGRSYGKGYFGPKYALLNDVSVSS